MVTTLLLHKYGYNSTLLSMITTMVILYISDVDMMGVYSKHVWIVGYRPKSKWLQLNHQTHVCLTN